MSSEVPFLPRFRRLGFGSHGLGLQLLLKFRIILAAALQDLKLPRLLNHFRCVLDDLIILEGIELDRLD